MTGTTTVAVTFCDSLGAEYEHPLNVTLRKTNNFDVAQIQQIGDAGVRDIETLGLLSKTTTRKISRMLGHLLSDVGDDALVGVKMYYLSPIHKWMMIGAHNRALFDMFTDFVEETQCLTKLSSFAVIDKIISSDYATSIVTLSSVAGEYPDLIIPTNAPMIKDDTEFKTVCNQLDPDLTGGDSAGTLKDLIQDIRVDVTKNHKLTGEAIDRLRVVTYITRIGYGDWDKNFILTLCEAPDDSVEVFNFDIMSAPSAEFSPDLPRPTVSYTGNA